MLIPWKTYTIDDLKFRLPDKSKMRESVKILLIDDQPFEHEDALRGLGFNITTYKRWNSVRDAIPYEIIVSDIRDVTPDFPSLPSQGANMLYQVKKDYPEKVCIVYTSSPITKDDDKSLFDGMNLLGKSDDIDDWATLLDDKIQLLRNPKNIWFSIEHYLEQIGVSQKFINKKQDKYVRCLLSGKASTLKDLFNEEEASKADFNINQILNILNGAIKIASLFS